MNRSMKQVFYQGVILCLAPDPGEPSQISTERSWAMVKAIHANPNINIVDANNLSKCVAYKKLYNLKYSEEIECKVSKIFVDTCQ